MLMETNDSYGTSAAPTVFAPVGNSAAQDRDTARQADSAQPIRRRMGAAMECYISAHGRNLGRMS
jgi:hypothetical protein